MTSSMTRRVVIIYNADGTVTGKLRYAYKKLFASKGQDAGKPSEPACGNCEITHGGLSLTETSAWTSSKEALQSSLDIKVEQLHRDELDARLKDFVKSNSIRLPTVLLDDSNSVKEIVPRDQINVCVLGSKDTSGSIDEQRATLLVESIRSAMQSGEHNAKL